MIITAVAASFSHEGEATTASETLARDFTWMMLSLLSKWQLFLCFKLLSQAARMLHQALGSVQFGIWALEGVFDGLLTSCVFGGKLFNVREPRFLHQNNGFIIVLNP